MDGWMDGQENEKNGPLLQVPNTKEYLVVCLKVLAKYQASQTLT